MENPVIDICKKVEAMLLLEENKKESTNKPKQKSKGFVVRNISDDTQPFNKDNKMTPIEYVVDVGKTLRNMEVDKVEENKDG